MKGTWTGLEDALEARISALGRTPLLTLAVAVPVTGVLAVTATEAEAAGLRTLLVLGFVGLGLHTAPMRGVITGDIVSGRAAFWLQKPVAPVRHFLAAGGEALLAGTILHLALAAVAIASVGLFHPAGLAQSVGAARMLLLVGLHLSVMAFGLSGAGIRSNVLLAYLLLVAALGFRYVGDIGPETATGRIADVLVPLSALREVVVTADLGGYGRAGAGLLISLVAWALVGALGARMQDLAPRENEGA